MATRATETSSKRSWGPGHQGIQVSTIIYHDEQQKSRMKQTVKLHSPSLLTLFPLVFFVLFLFLFSCWLHVAATRRRQPLTTTRCRASSATSPGELTINHPILFTNTFFGVLQRFYSPIPGSGTSKSSITGGASPKDITTESVRGWKYFLDSIS